MSSPNTQPEADEGNLGALPNAPLAMPKQVLTSASWFSLRKFTWPRAIKTGH